MTENIGHRASIYVEEYTLSSSIRSSDAIIAATAIENNMTLSSSNAKHFKVIKKLKLKILTNFRQKMELRVFLQTRYVFLQLILVCTVGCALYCTKLI
jgi:hypothetical protein